MVYLIGYGYFYFDRQPIIKVPEPLGGNIFERTNTMSQSSVETIKAEKYKPAREQTIMEL